MSKQLLMVATILCMMVCTCCTALAENDTTLVQQQGEERTDSSTFVPYEKNGLWGYRDQTGKTVLEPQWHSVGFFRQDTAVAALDETHWGIIDSTGAVLVPFEYDWIEDRYSYAFAGRCDTPVDEENFLGGRENGFYRVGNDGKKNTMGFYSIATRTLAEPQWDEVIFGLTEYSDNELILVCDYEIGLWGYADWYGNMAIPCQYLWAYPFLNGEAEIVTNTEQCTIDLNGRQTSPWIPFE